MTLSDMAYIVACQAGHVWFQWHGERKHTTWIYSTVDTLIAAYKRSLSAFLFPSQRHSAAALNAITDKLDEVCKVYFSRWNCDSKPASSQKPKESSSSPVAPVVDDEQDHELKEALKNYGIMI